MIDGSRTEPDSCLKNRQFHNDRKAQAGTPKKFIDFTCGYGRVKPFILRACAKDDCPIRLWHQIHIRGSEDVVEHMERTLIEPQDLTLHRTERTGKIEVNCCQKIVPGPGRDHNRTGADTHPVTPATERSIVATFYCDVPCLSYHLDLAQAKGLQECRNQTAIIDLVIAS